ncbi:MAG: hypothetical protein VB913_15815 [Rhodospirillales bacterium]
MSRLPGVADGRKSNGSGEDLMKGFRSRKRQSSDWAEGSVE